MNILDRIIRFSLDFRLLIAGMALLIVAAGLLTAHRTEVDVFPDLNAPTVAVMTEAGGMAAREVEQLVTFPVETALNGASGVRRVRSSSTAGFSVVWVEFDWDTDVYRARQIVAEKLSAVAGELPAGVNAPVMGPQSSILGEVLIVGLTTLPSDSLKPGTPATSMLDLRTLAEWQLRPRLLSVEGVAQVSVIGGEMKEYQIRLDPPRMRHYGVTVADVMAATRGIGDNPAGGVLYEYGNEYTIRAVASADVMQRLENAVVKSDGEWPVRLADVADIRIGGEEPRLGAASVRARDAVLLTVTKQPGTGTIPLTERLEEVVADASASFPADVRVATDIFRQFVIYRCLDLECEDIAHRRGHICGDNPFPVPGECAHHSDFTCHYPCGASCDDYNTTLARRKHQHHESGRYGNSHRFAGGRCHRGRGECLATSAPQPCPSP